MSVRRRPRGAHFTTAALLTVAAAAIVGAVGGCGTESSAKRWQSSQPETSEVASEGGSPVATTTPPTTVDPGTLPQTRDKPEGSSSELDAGARALWGAIVADDPSIAMSFFFPLSAYEQVKDIANPASDWHNRLIAAYERDVHALHRQLGADGSRAEFSGINVPVAQAQWINPGGEYNKIGYWRVYGTKLDYRIGAKSSSLPVYSLISWRGRWYVVHLGPIK